MSTPSIFRHKKLSNLEKPRERDADSSSSISRLPDEITLQILNKLIDLKTLCVCFLVSKRFSLIVLQVDAISFTCQLINPPIPDKNTVGDVHANRPVSSILSSLYGESFIPAYRFLGNFKEVKSLCIELPSSSHKAIDNRCLFKWKAKFGTKIESFIFLLSNSISDKDEIDLNGSGDEEENDEAIMDMFTQYFDIALNCLKDVMGWRILLLDLVKTLPMLEKVSFTDLGRRGRLSVSGEKLSALKEWVNSASEAVVYLVELPDIMTNGHIHVLNLRASGLVMKDVYFCVMEMNDLQGGYEGLMNSNDGIEDKEDAAYTEAMMEILEKHMD